MMLQSPYRTDTIEDIQSNKIIKYSWEGVDCKIYFIKFYIIFHTRLLGLMTTVLWV